MWSGQSSNIPSGWALCNGQNGTPNLQDRFIVGAGNQYSVGATGGANEVTLTTAQMPSHTHILSLSDLRTNSAGNHYHSYSYYPKYEDVEAFGSGGNGVSYNASYGTTDEAGAHTHTVTGSGSISPAGSGQSHENRPPYYALCFIMKL